jgi:hypothetical protein
VTRHRIALPLVSLALAVVAIVTTIESVLGAPGIPYNVSDLFLDHASVTAVGFFALGVLWIGAGAMIVAILLTATARPHLVLPLAIVVASLVSKMLVSRGVTYESLDDILGANNVFGLVAHNGLWGESWRGMFLRLGPDVIDFIERRVRYCALYSIPLVTLVLAFLPSAHTRRSGRRATPAAWVATVVVAALWLAIAATIVLRWAATDNLTELIASAGPLGIPGAIFLLAMLVVLAANVALVLSASRSHRGWMVALAGSVGAVALTWSLLNAGLEQHVQKYGVEFAGTQFLLGPDRQHALTGRELFVRWTLLYTSATAVVACGAWIAAALLEYSGTISRRSADPEVS